jgi:hypothetical protein
MDKEDIFKLTVGNESLCETSIDNMDVVINYATSKYLVDIKKFERYRFWIDKVINYIVTDNTVYEVFH